MWSDPVVGADDATYLLVSSGYLNYAPGSSEVTSAWHTLQLLRVQPDGIYTFRDLAQGVGADGGGADDWPDGLAVNADGRLIALQRNRAGGSIWLIDGAAVTAAALPANVTGSRLIVTAERILVGGNNNVAALDPATLSWLYVTPGVLLAPAPDGGATVGDAQTSDVATRVSRDGTPLMTGPATAAFWSADEWHSVTTSSVGGVIGLTGDYDLFRLDSGTASNQKAPKDPCRRFVNSTCIAQPNGIQLVRALYYAVSAGYSSHDRKVVNEAAEYWNRVLASVGVSFRFEPVTSTQEADLNVFNRSVQTTPGVFYSDVGDGSGTIFIRDDYLQCEAPRIVNSQPQLRRCDLLRQLVTHEFGHSLGHKDSSCGQGTTVMQSPVNEQSGWFISKKNKPLDCDACATKRIYRP